MAQDDECHNARLTLVALGFQWVDPQRAKIRFTYDASDPNAITSTPTDPYVLPASGKVRLWNKDSSLARNAAPVGQGGDYFVPGVEYSLADIGTSIYGHTIYVEAVKLSETVADISIKVEVDPTGSAGFVWSDQLRFTGSKVAFVGYTYEDPLPGHVPDPTEVNHLVASDISRVMRWHELYDFTPNSYLRYRARVFDPRANLQTFIVNSVSLSLQRQEQYYQTEQFICMTPGAISDENVPGLRYVPLSNENAHWEYNPGDEIPSAGRPGRTPAARNLLGKHVEAVCDSLWQSFEGTASEWGKAVEAEVAGLLQSDRLWVHSVRVSDLDGKIVSIDRVLTPTTVPPIDDTTEIDFVRLKRGQRLRVGDTWSMGKVEEIYELKTSLTAKVTGDQRTRLLALVEGDATKLIVAEGGKYAVQENGRLKLNPRWLGKGYLFKALNAAAATVFTIFAMIEVSDASDDFVDAYVRYKEADKPSLAAITARTDMERAMQTIADKSDPSGGISAAIIKKILEAQFIKDLSTIDGL